MSELNRSVKQNKRAIMILLVAGISALLLCIVANVVVNTKIAYASPTMEQLSETLDRTSAQYGDAIAAQEEAQAKVNQAEATIEECEREIPIVQGKLCTRAKNMYVNKSFGEMIDLLLGATSIEELVNTLQYISIINQKDSALVDSCKTLKAQVESEKASLDENLAIAKEQANIAASAYKQAQAALAEAERHQQQGGGGGGGQGGGGGGTHVDPVTGNIVADRALMEQGKPYIWTAVGPTGYDCSGLVSYALTGIHKRVGTTTTFCGWPRLSSPEVGCVCTNDHHCGIYVGNGMMCHAPYPGKCVGCDSLSYFSMIYVTTP